MIKTGVVNQNEIIKVDFDENGEQINEKVIKAKQRDTLDEEETDK